MAKVLVFIMFGLFLIAGVSIAVILIAFLFSEKNVATSKRVLVTIFPVLVLFPSFHVEEKRKEVKQRIILSSVCISLGCFIYVYLTQIM